MLHLKRHHQSQNDPEKPLNNNKLDFKIPKQIAINHQPTTQPEITTTKSFESLFDTFVHSNSSKSICKSFDSICKHLKINPKQIHESGYALLNSQNHPNTQITTPPLLNSNKYSPNYTLSSTTTTTTSTRLIYKVIQSKTNYWKANELWKKYDKKVSCKDYANTSKTTNQINKSSSNLNVLIIGCGPVGLRLSIELALMGIKCTIVEKRDRFSRNNVLHLWPFTIVDLKNLGAKLFYGKFCAGSIDHISIRKLQCILLKCALLLGVQVCFNTQFEEIVEPSNLSINAVVGWGARCLPENHELNTKTFDVIIG
jgi:hypothetical protein